MFGHFKCDYGVCILLEYVSNGDLYKYLHKSDEIKESLIARWIYQLTLAIEYCHQHSIIHRDIKIDNLLLDSSFNLKLVDFGWSIESSENLTGHHGTLDYFSPELLNNNDYNEKVNIWS